MRAFVYIDAENHYLRSIDIVKSIVDTDNAVTSFIEGVRFVPAIQGVPSYIQGRSYGYNPELQLFWDCTLLSPGGILSEFMPEVKRSYYVGSNPGDEETNYNSKITLRSYGFDPIIIQEKKVDLKQRENSRSQFGLIEKPKGCDIMIATKIISDAAANLYDICILFSSDSDFIPALEAIRSMGKIALVFGYERYLKANSPYLHVPDKFYDLERHIKNDFNDNKDKILNKT